MNPLHGDDLRVIVCTPMQDQCATAYCASLVHMVSHTLTSIDSPPGLTIGFLQLGTSILPLSRQLLVQHAMERGCTHVLFIDSDMEFPPDLLLRLVAHRRQIVAVNCISRRPPYLVTARRNEEQVHTRADSTGLEMVDSVGTGIIMIAIEVFKRLPPPWFHFEWIPEKWIFRGEDYGFCRSARAAGYEISIDHDLSKQVKHVGSFGFSPLFVSESNAELAAAKPPEYI